MKNGFAFVVSLMWFNCFFYSMVGTRVYVGGLPYGTRERDLERFFRGYGRFRDVLIKNGYGFVVSTCIEFYTQNLTLRCTQFGPEKSSCRTIPYSTFLKVFGGRGKRCIDTERDACST